jgi:hypothetical protein
MQLPVVCVRVKVGAIHLAAVASPPGVKVYTAHALQPTAAAAAATGLQQQQQEQQDKHAFSRDC